MILITNKVFLCAADDVSVAAAPVESFTLAMKLVCFLYSLHLSFAQHPKDGLAVTLCNGHGGVCILFDDETTLKAFAQSIADILPAMAQALDFEGTIVDGSEEVYTSDSLLSELSASDFSGIEADEEGFEWEVVDNLTL